jgi:hypothetical protein
MIVHEVLIQGSEQWLRKRKGKVTASAADRLLTATGKDSSQWDAYAIELIAECLRPDELPPWTGNHHTDRGNELEAEARDVFAAWLGQDVRQVGFVERDHVVGCSPDALVYNQEGQPVAGVEIKCPLAKHHISYIVEGGVPAKYRPQVHFSMAVTGLPWWFVSYCQGMVAHIVEVQPDSYTERMRDAINRFVIYYSQRFTALKPKLLGKEVAA